MLSWYQKTHSQWLQRYQSGQMPHAILLTGQEGIGKYEFAIEFGKTVLCENLTDDLRACGQCHACRMNAAQTHPDLLRVELEANNEGKISKEIKVDQIRDLCARLALTSQFSGYKVAVICPADQMNRNAANSLLKTLEEPTPDTLLILVASNPTRLPPTIRSRCQIEVLASPTNEQITNWLQQQFQDKDIQSLLLSANHSPKLAFQIAEEGFENLRIEFWQSLLLLAHKKADPVDQANNWYSKQPELLLKWFLSWVYELIKLKMSHGQYEIHNVDLAQDLQAVAKQIDLRLLFKFADRLIQAKSLLLSSANIQLIFDNLLLNWTAINNAKTG